MHFQTGRSSQNIATLFTLVLQKKYLIIKQDVLDILPLLQAVLCSVAYPYLQVALDQ